MKAVVFALVMFTIGCHTPCERTARYVVAMGRSCHEVGDAELLKVCRGAFESMATELTVGTCKAEVTK